MQSMNPQPDVWSRIGLDRNKTIMIVALSLVLIVVLVIQFGGSSTATTIPTANRTALKKSKPGSRVPKLTSDADRREIRASRNTAEPRVISDEKKVPATPEIQEPQPQSSPSHSPASQSTTEKDSDRPPVDIDQLKIANPFRLPLEIGRMKKAQEQQRQRELAAKAKREREHAALVHRAKVESAISKLQREGIRLVFIRGEERAAQIGTRIVKVGDIIDGVRIAEIRDNGSVILEVPKFDPAKLSFVK